MAEPRPTTHLQTAKLRRPVDPATSLSRPQLERALEGIPSARVVTVVGPAGFGKTTTMSQLQQSFSDRGIATSWLTLDAHDNDVGRFAAYLHRALGRVSPVVAAIDAPRAERLDGTRGLGLSFALAVIDAVASSTEPFALFLDEFELIREPEVLTLVSRLIGTLGAQQLLVIGSREMPDVGVARLRGRGQLLEIGLSALRFSEDETRRFLIELRNCPTFAGDVPFLHTKSEGWPAALHLAALAFGDHPERAQRLRDFTGSLAEVADYLAEEVIGRQSDELREFMLDTSILDTFCAELCDEVTGRAGSAGVIEQIVRASLFVVSLDPDRRWYRYHALYREFLRTRREETAPGSATELHRRAAHWYSGQNNLGSAVEHALKAGDPQFAAGIMERCAAGYFDDGRLATLVEWANALPAVLLERHRHLHFFCAAAMTLMHHYADAERLVRRYADGLDSTDMVSRRDLTTLRYMLVLWSDRLPDLRSVLDEGVALFSPADGFMYPAMLNATAYLGILERKPAVARSALSVSKIAAANADNQVVRAYAEGAAALVHLLRGEISDAVDTTRAEFDRIIGSGDRYASQTGIVATILSDALYTRNDIPAVRTLLDEYLKLIEDSALPDLIIIAFILRARIAVCDGEPERAIEWLGRLQRVGERRGLSRLVASARLENARCALLSGRIDTAISHTEEASTVACWSSPLFLRTFASDFAVPEIAQARVRLFRGGTAAIAPLEEEVRQAGADGRIRRSLVLRTLLAQALWIAGRRPQALKEIEAVLRAAAPEGLVRTLADEPWVLTDMLTKFTSHADPVLAKFARDVVDAAAGTHLTDAASPSREAAPNSILSEREIEVLRGVTQGLSNKGIARRLGRSEATIATHLRRINEKLGTHTRTQAIAVARRSGLIE